MAVVNERKPRITTVHLGQFTRETANVIKRMSGGQQVDVFENPVNPSKPIFRHFYWTTATAEVNNAPVFVLNASPESAVGGGLALLQTGDRILIDLNTCRCDALVDEPRGASEDLASELFRFAVAKGLALIELSPVEATLEEVFLELIRGGMPAPVVSPASPSPDLGARP